MWGAIKHCSLTLIGAFPVMQVQYYIKGQLDKNLGVDGNSVKLADENSVVSCIPKDVFLNKKPHVF